MMEKNRLAVVANEDNESLHAWGNKNFTIGNVDEVNVAGAVEVPDFVPTRDELIQIVKYWAKERLDNAWFFFGTGQTGSSEWRIDLFAARRINRIAEILGEDEVTKAVDEVYEMFGQTMDKTLWNIFLNGPQEQWDAVLEESYRKPMQEENPMMNLVRPKVYLNFDHTSWRFILDLAYQYGWQPVGTVAPPDYRTKWENYYDENWGQRVTNGDAKCIADALEKALDDIPDHNAMRKVDKDKQLIGIPRSKEIPLVMNDVRGAKREGHEIDTSITALEYLSGERKKSVRDFMDFCREGSFYFG